MLSGRIVSQLLGADVHAHEDVALLDGRLGRRAARARRPGCRGRRGAWGDRRDVLRGDRQGLEAEDPPDRVVGAAGRRRAPARTGAGRRAPGHSRRSAAADRHARRAARPGVEQAALEVQGGRRPAASPTRTSSSPGLKPRRFRRAPGLHLRRPRRPLRAPRCCSTATSPCQVDGQPPGAQHLGGDPLDLVDRQGEADPLRPGPDGHVDPDQLAVDVDQRAARVARVDAGVGLDQVAIDLVVGERHVAMQGADDARPRPCSRSRTRCRS